MNNELKFEFRPKLGMPLLGIFVLGGFGISLAFTALTNDRGLILNHILKFSVQGATIVYWVISALFIYITVLTTIALIFSFLARGRIYIRLTPSDMYILQGLLKKKIRQIPFKEITGLIIREMRGHHFLCIKHPSGNIDISQSALPTQEDFDQILRFIVEHIKK
jgi:hypothetical protein